MTFTYDKQLGYRIKTFREQQGLSQAQLAAKLQTSGCDLTRSGLAKIEVGQRHLYSYEIKVFKTVLNVRYEDLFV